MSATCCLEGMKMGGMMPSLILSHTMTIQLNVLSSCMIDMIRGQGYNRCTATKHVYKSRSQDGKIFKQTFEPSQFTCGVVSANPLYSTSVEDLNTTVCFLDCRKMREPRKMQEPLPHRSSREGASTPITVTKGSFLTVGSRMEE